MAFDELVWSVHLRANKERNARRVLQRVLAAVGKPAEEHSLERYWKLPGQYVAVFATALDAHTVPELVFETMLAAQRIASGWLVLGPHCSGDGSWTLELVCDRRFRVVGVEFADLRVETRQPTVRALPAQRRL